MGAIKRYLMTVHRDIQETATNNFVALAANVFKSKFIYYIDVTNLARRGLSVFKQFFHNIPERVYFSNNMRSTETEVSTQEPTNIKASTTYYSIYVYNGTPILLSVYSDGEVRLVTLNTDKNKNMLNKFLEHIKKCIVCSTRNDPRRPYTQYGRGYDKIYYNFPKRTFKDVFITSDNENMIRSTVQQFIKNKKWYTEHHIPYHLGIILYGEPGTGKSSTVQAIVNEFNLTRIVANAENLRGSMNSIIENDEVGDDITAIIVEDVDLEPDVKCRESEYEFENKYTRNLGFLMNTMDGIGCLENVIYIFTTNSIETLDKAILRPGRLDLHINISYVNDETFNKFLNFHYKKQIPVGRTLNRTDLTCAELQTCVMSGYTFSQMIEKFTKDIYF